MPLTPYIHPMSLIAPLRAPVGRTAASVLDITGYPFNVIGTGGDPPAFTHSDLPGGGSPSFEAGVTRPAPFVYIGQGDDPGRRYDSLPFDGQAPYSDCASAFPSALLFTTRAHTVNDDGQLLPICGLRSETLHHREALQSGNVAMSRDFILGKLLLPDCLRYLKIPNMRPPAMSSEESLNLNVGLPGQ